MENDVLQVAEYASNQPGVTGYLCVDKEGLCLVANGQATQSMSGIVHQLAKLAGQLEDSSQQNKTNGSKDNPVIRVDLDRYKITMQSTNSITTALISNQK